MLFLDFIWKKFFKNGERLGLLSPLFEKKTFLYRGDFKHRYDFRLMKLSVEKEYAEFLTLTTKNNPDIKMDFGKSQCIGEMSNVSQLHIAN